MIKIYELTTADRRVYRVVIANKNQQKRLFKVIKNSQSNSCEKITKYEVISNGIHSVGDFEKHFEDLV